jgi:septum formation protein
VLGSTSRYRRELLERLGIAFDVDRPEVDESPRAGESPADLVVRLAREKALAVAGRHPGAWVIGSDQVAELDGRPLGKPGGRDAAIAQLEGMSAREVEFVTAACLARDDRVDAMHVDHTIVRFRTLASDEIMRYVDAEQPFDCAGSFKSEGRGITLFDAIESTDPTALIGLPLIATARMLRAAGFALP